LATLTGSPSFAFVTLPSEMPVLPITTFGVGPFSPKAIRHAKRKRIAGKISLLVRVFIPVELPVDIGVGYIAFGDSQQINSAILRIACADRHKDEEQDD
jgi:hypothetical protein